MWPFRLLRRGLWSHRRGAVSCWIVRQTCHGLVNLSWWRIATFDQAFELSVDACHFGLNLLLFLLVYLRWKLCNYDLRELNYIAVLLSLCNHMWVWADKHKFGGLQACLFVQNKCTYDLRDMNYIAVLLPLCYHMYVRMIWPLLLRLKLSYVLSIRQK